MAKGSRVRQDLDSLKPTVDESITPANSLVTERFLGDKLDETCERAQDVDDVLKFRTHKDREALKQFQAIADTSPEEEALLAKLNPY